MACLSVSREQKVVFLARTVPLVSQQFKIFTKYLRSYRVSKRELAVKSHRTAPFLLSFLLAFVLQLSLQNFMFLESTSLRVNFFSGNNSNKYKTSMGAVS